MIREWLGINKIEKNVDQLTEQVADLVRIVNHHTDGFRDYKNQTDDKLNYMFGTVESLLRQAEERQEQDLSDDEYRRVKSVIHKLRYNRTKIQNALSSRG